MLFSEFFDRTRRKGEEEGRTNERTTEGIQIHTNTYSEKESLVEKNWEWEWDASQGVSECPELTNCRIILNKIDSICIQQILEWIHFSMSYLRLCFRISACQRNCPDPLQGSSETIFSMVDGWQGPSLDGGPMPSIKAKGPWWSIYLIRENMEINNSTIGYVPKIAYNAFNITTKHYSIRY